RLHRGAKVARGLGLGLSIVERIARVLDHRVSVESLDGKGSRFAVEVPLAPTLPTELRPRPAERPDPLTLADLTILCIDNDRSILDGMQTLLGGWGCRVLTATDLMSAQQLAVETRLRPQGMLVDYHLDDGTGIDAIVELRWRFGDVPAILITADRSPR